MNSDSLHKISSTKDYIKILDIIFTDRVSGPARQLFQLIKVIDASRYGISIASTATDADKSEFLCEVEKCDIPYHILPQRFFIDPTPITVVCKRIKKQQYDVIQSHGYKSAFIAFFAHYLANIPWVAFLHGHTTENLKVRLYHALEFKLVKHADKIITVSHEMRERLVSRGLPAERTVVIQNALDPQEFAASAKPHLRKKFGVKPDEKLIGIIGRFSPEKGVDVFLEAFKLLSKSDTSLKAILIGEGLLEAELRNYCSTHQINDRVIFAGYQKDIAEFYPILDMMVMPSRSEGLPNVALEALHFGVPVVATDVGGTSEVIIDGKTGLLVPSERPDLMQAAMSTLFADEGLRCRLIKQGKQHLSENFSPKSRVEKIERIYSELAGRA